MSAPLFSVGDAVIWPNGVPGYVRGVDGDLLLDDCGGWIESADVDHADRPVETYRGVQILHRKGDGYHASASIAVHFGYCDRIEDLRVEVDDHFAEQAGDPPLDTPSIDTSFHDHEMGSGL